MADDKKNIPEVAPPAEAPAPEVGQGGEKGGQAEAAHRKGQARQTRQRPTAQGWQGRSR